MMLGGESTRPFCAFFPVFSDIHITDLSVLLRKLPTSASLVVRIKFPRVETFIAIIPVHLSVL